MIASSPLSQHHESNGRGGITVFHVLTLYHPGMHLPGRCIPTNLNQKSRFCLVELQSLLTSCYGLFRYPTTYDDAEGDDDSLPVLNCY
jgi:hypothetical protein